MNRKNAFIIMLLLCFSTGMVACILAFQPNMSTAVPTISAPTVQATLSAPTGAVEEKKEAVLPALPTLPESSDVLSSDVPEKSEADESTAPEPRYSYTASHSSQRLFVRQEPSLRAKIIGSLKPGDSGEVIRIEEAWVLVNYKETEGYVFKEYLTLTELPQ